MNNIIIVLILSTCILIPYCVIMIVIGVVSYKSKLPGAIKYLEQFNRSRMENQLETKPSIILNIFIFVAFSIMCLIAIVVGIYLITILQNINLVH
jgi:hypothetical protein